MFATDYTHYNGETYQQWSSIDNLNGNNPQESHTYKQDYDGNTRNQRREFSIFVDGDLTKKLQH